MKSKSLYSSKKEENPLKKRVPDAEQLFKCPTCKDFFYLPKRCNRCLKCPTCCRHPKE